MSDSTATNSDIEEPTSDQIVAMLFGAAMSGDELEWARVNAVDPKLLQLWKFTHAQEYIIYLERVLRMIRKRAGTTGTA